MSWLVSAGLTPHGFCLLWQPGLLAWMIVGDALVSVSYFLIPVMLVLLLLRWSTGSYRLRLPREVVLLFAAFIALCGLTHVMDIVTIYWPAYWPQVVIKLATGIVSATTVATLWPPLLLIPKEST